MRADRGAGSATEFDHRNRVATIARPERYQPNEFSAIRHAMNLLRLHRGHAADGINRGAGHSFQ
jgi:hypothetical protein